MTSLSLTPASKLEVGDRFRYLEREHTVTGIDSHLDGLILDIHVDDRPTPVTLLRWINVTLVEGAAS